MAEEKALWEKLPSLCRESTLSLCLETTATACFAQNEKKEEYIIPSVEAMLNGRVKCNMRMWRVFGVLC